MRPPGSGRQVGAATCGRGLGTERGARGEGARALPVMGSEVLGTERGTRPDTGPLTSAATNSKRKGEARGGPGPGWGRAAEAGILGSAWPPGGAHPAASAGGHRAAGLGPLVFPPPGSACDWQKKRKSAPPIQEGTNGRPEFLLQPIGVKWKRG